MRFQLAISLYLLSKELCCHTLQMLLLTYCLQEQLGVMIALLVVPTWLIFHCKSSVAHYCQVHAKNGRIHHYASLQQWCCGNHSHRDTHMYSHGSHTYSLSHWQYHFLRNSILVKTSKVLFQIGTNRD